MTSFGLRSSQLFILFCFFSLSLATTRKVPQEYAKIQLAIDAAVNGDTVLVAEGTYMENIIIRKKIVLASVYIVDQDTSHISKTILDGGTPAQADSASVIRVYAGTDTTTVITGFTIRNGKGTKLDLAGTSDWISGGGILVYAGGAKIVHNIITQNILNTSFGAYGGGITVEPTNGPIDYWVIEYNHITKNEATTSTISSGLAAEGSGVWLTGNGRFTNNVVSGNIATANGTTSAGGGIFLVGPSNALIANNDVRENYAKNGGGFWMGAASQSARPLVTVQNNIIAGNTGVSGSAMNILSGDFMLVNNTVADNIGDFGIRLFASRGALTFRLLNNILWNSAATTELTAGVGSVYVTNSCILGGYAGTGIITTDPLFAPGDLYYRLSDSSPCIAAGVPSASVGGLTLQAPSTDYFHLPRPQGGGSMPDLGAVENPLPTSVGVAIENAGMPVSFGLEQNYPNPFNPSTTIRYSLVNVGNLDKVPVSIKIYDMLGREIATLVNEEQSAGWKEVVWNASEFASGMYLVRMVTGHFMETKKILLMK